MRVGLWVVNDANKSSFEAFLPHYAPFLKEHYAVQLATDGTAKILRRFVPDVRAIGHGPRRGDFYAAKHGLDYALQGHEVHLHFWIDSAIEPHEWYKQFLRAFATHEGWVLFPNEATSRCYLEAASASPVQPRPLTHQSPPAEEWIAIPDSLKVKLYTNRADKRRLVDYVVQHEITDGLPILVDSGSTPARLASALAAHGRAVAVNTNNVLLAADGFGKPNEIELFRGAIDREYFATYPTRIEECFLMLRDLKCQATILGAVGLNYRHGPCVRARDLKNQVFKEILVRKSLTETDNKLIVLVDASKLAYGRDLDDDTRFSPVLPPTVWRDVLARPDFVLVTSSPDQLHSAQADIARLEIKRFRANASRGGLRFVMVS